MEVLLQIFIDTEKKHPSILEKVNKDKNIGSMEKFVNIIPVCLNFYIIFFIN